MGALFRYRSGATVEDLELGECTMRVAIDGGKRYWHMWFRDNRDPDGVLFDFCVPMNPNGDYDANGIGGKTWGLRDLGDGRWQVSPSIDVLNTGEVHAGDDAAPLIKAAVARSLWHQTPQIAGVPPGERWIAEPA